MHITGTMAVHNKHSVRNYLLSLPTPGPHVEQVEEDEQVGEADQQAAHNQQNSWPAHTACGWPREIQERN